MLEEPHTPADRRIVVERSLLDDRPSAAPDDDDSNLEDSTGYYFDRPSYSRSVAPVAGLEPTAELEQTGLKIG